MCGISGIAGFKNIAVPLLDSIRHLEYRGYDACGIAILGLHGIERGYQSLMESWGLPIRDGQHMAA